MKRKFSEVIGIILEAYDTKEYAGKIGLCNLATRLQREKTLNYGEGDAFITYLATLYPDFPARHQYVWNKDNIGIRLRWMDEHLSYNVRKEVDKEYNTCMKEWNKMIKSKKTETEVNLRLHQETVNMLELEGMGVTSKEDNDEVYILTIK